MTYTFSLFFFFNDTATTEIYTLSLHDALPIFHLRRARDDRLVVGDQPLQVPRLYQGGNPDRPRHLVVGNGAAADRSEEHTSELQSQSNLVCRLLLEKKKNQSIQLNQLMYCPSC